MWLPSGKFKLKSKYTAQSYRVKYSSSVKMHISPFTSFLLPIGGLSESLLYDANFERMKSVNNQLSYAIDMIESFNMAD